MKLYVSALSVLLLYSICASAMQNHEYNSEMRRCIYNGDLKSLQELLRSPETNDIKNKYNKALEITALFNRII